MATAVLDRGPFAATDEDRSVIGQIEQLFERSSSRNPRLVGSNGEEIELPSSVMRVLRHVVHVMNEDRVVSVVPTEKDLTTQQAADLLNVSRPFLVKLLDGGKIPFSKVGTHRRVRFDDAMAYKQCRSTERRESLRRLSQMSQELGLYDFDET